METTINKLRINEQGIVKKINAEKKLKRRLLDMGVTYGTVITMRKAAPFGDPYELTVRGYELTMRKSEAEVVVVEKIDKNSQLKSEEQK